MTSVKGRQIVKLNVEPASIRANVKIRWDFPDLEHAGTYVITRSTLLQRSSEVREELKDLVNESLRRGIGVLQCGLQLKRLAKAGHDLFDALFSHRLDGHTSVRPEKILQKLNSLHADDVRVVVVLHRTDLCVRWGLIFDGNPNGLCGDPTDIHIAIYQDFWCLKYIVSVVAPGLRTRLDQSPIRSDACYVIPAFNKGVYDTTRPAVSMIEQGILDALFGEGLKWQAVYNKDALLERLRDIDVSDKDGVLYFFCHANEKSLALGTDRGDNFTPSDFEQYITNRYLSHEGGCLVFLNGCSTVTAEPENGFLRSLGEPGYYGFIGTEAPVPRVYALRFGLAFMYYYLLDQETVIDIIQKLRIRHWPLSLLYAVYCDPRLQVEQPIDSGIRGLRKSYVQEEANNFSLQHVGLEWL